ncbi:MAG: NAD(P)H-quinone oxidoreductase [Deltaproteobacteria bacterium]
MRAVVVTEAGGPEALRVSDVEAPTPRAGEVLVRVRAAGVNRADILQRMGLYPAPPGVRPDVLGLEFAGEVVQSSEGSGSLRNGDRVMAIAAGAAQAEFVVAPERLLLPIPAGLTFEEAAALPEAFLTAHDAMIGQAGLSLGETVLVHAVTSGVGTAAVQLARAAGCTVIGTSRSQEKLERAVALGLTHPLAVGADGRFSDAVLEATHGRGADVVVDLVGASYLGETLRAMALGGRLVAIGLLGGARAELDLGRLLARRLRLFGTTLRSRPPEEKARVTQRFLKEALPLFDWGPRGHGLLRPVVDRAFPLEEVRAAHERMASGAHFGKIVLTL